MSPRRTGGSFSVRNSHGANAIGFRPGEVYAEAKMMQMKSPMGKLPSLAPQQGLKNLSGNDLNRFIDKRLTDFRKSTVQYQLHKTLGEEGYLDRIEDEQQNGIMLKKKLN